MSYSEQVENLLRGAEGGNLVGVHLDGNDPGSFEAGQIVSWQDDCFSLRCIDLAGDDDGFVVAETSHVWRVHSDSEYLRGVQSLWKLSVAARDVVRPVPNIAETIRAAYGSNEMVKVFDGNEGVEGIVVEVGTEYFALSASVENGLADGRFTFPTTNITRVDIGRRSLVAQRMLHKLRYGE